jgi:hypothetical protein
MARLRVPLLLCFALLASATGAVAGTVEERGTSTTVSGVYSVTFNLSILSTLPAGTMITCRAQISPNQGGRDLRNGQPSAIPASVVGRVALTGSKATCAAEIPFAWTVTGAQGGLMLRYEIEAVSGSGVAPLQVRSSTAFPASAGSARLSLNVAL